jgi:hypothetical protein
MWWRDPVPRCDRYRGSCKKASVRDGRIARPSTTDAPSSLAAHVAEPMTLRSFTPSYRSVTMSRHPASNGTVAPTVHGLAGADAIWRLSE